MSVRPRFMRRHARRIAGVVILVPLYALARLPATPEVEAREIAARFAFERHELPLVSERAPRTTRPVHPDLAHIEGWINVLGAGVALCDLDGNGLSDDLLLSDPRTDEVSVQPAPGTGPRYRPFVIEPRGVRYERDRTAPMGCVPCDMNEDGLLDVLVYYWGRPPLAFLRLAGAAKVPSTEAFVAREIVSEPERWYTNAATFADVDGDGHADLIVGNYFADGDAVLDPRGGGPASMQTSMSRALNGGRNRLLLWKDARSGTTPSIEFADRSAAFDEEVQHAWTLAAGAADLDGDLLPEIYFANDFGHDRLLHNRSRRGEPAFARLEGRRSPTMPSSKVLGRDSFKGMGVDFGDVNGDGRLDIYVSNITTEFGLQESQFLFASTGAIEAMRDGVAPYVDESAALGLARSGWAWDAKLDDYDNDGVLEAQQALGFLAGTTSRWPELHEIAMAADPLVPGPLHWHRFGAGDDLSGHDVNPFFVRDARGRFCDVAARVGLGAREVRRGIASADVDGDGDLDFAVANQWCASALYENVSPNVGAVLELSLLLPIAQQRGDATLVRRGRPDPALPARSALGAIVTLERPSTSSSDGPAPRARVAVVDGGNGHSGARSPDVRLGLGRVDAAVTHGVRIAWRDTFGARHEQRFELVAGRTIIYLGAEEAHQ